MQISPILYTTPPSERGQREERGEGVGVSECGRMAFVGWQINSSAKDVGSLSPPPLPSQERGWTWTSFSIQRAIVLRFSII